MTNKLALLVAFILAILAIYGVVQYVEKKKREVETGAKRVSVAVMAKDARAGDTLTEDMVVEKEIPETTLKHMKSLVLWDRWSNFKNNVFAVDVDKEQFLRHDYFPAVLSAERFKLEDGERAYTLAVDRVSGVAGMLKPGDYVDVVASFESEPTDYAMGEYIVKFSQMAVTVCKKREVLALDNRIDPSGTYPNYRTITLRVTALEAERLNFSATFGKALQLVLRNGTEEVEPSRPLAVDNIDIHFLGLEGKPYKILPPRR